MFFISLPPEILLSILSLLELSDIARTRQSCRLLRDITQDRIIWTSLLARQRLLYPVPPWFSFLDTPPVIEIERAVVSTHRVAQAWPRPRRDPFKVKPTLGTMLIALEMFLDRWLLVVYAEGLAYLLDTMSDPIGTPADLNSHLRHRVCAKLVDTAEGRHPRVWNSCAAQVLNDERLLLVLANEGPRPVYCSVYEVALKSHTTFELIVSVPMSTQGLIRTVSVADKLLVLSRGSNIRLVDVSENPRRDLLVVSRFSEELEDSWNGTIEIRVFDRYMFAFKAHSIEVHNMDDLLATSERKFSPIPISKHFFQHVTFRDVKYSSPTITFDDDLLEIKFQAFANDVLTGLFDYEIFFQRRKTDPPIFNVTLLNLYPLADHMVAQLHAHWLTPPDPDLIAPPPSPTNEYGNAFRTTNLSTKGFVTAFTIGLNAKRAVWIERVRGSTVRGIHVWENYGTSGDHDLPGEIQGRNVYAITSLDLREDVIRCALGESTGLIVWGNRGGDLFLSDVNA